MKILITQLKSRTSFAFIGTLIALLLLVPGCLSLNSGLFRSKAASKPVSQQSAALRRQCKQCNSEFAESGGDDQVHNH